MQPSAAWILALLALCAAAAVPSAAAAPGTRPPARRTRSISADRWLNLISEYARGAAGGGGGGGGGGAWFPRPVPLELPLGGAGGAAGASVPVLLLPVPVPVSLPAPRPSAAECALNTYTGAAPATNTLATDTSHNYDTRTLLNTLGDGNLERTKFDTSSSRAPAAEPPRPPGPPTRRPLRTVPRFDPVDDSRRLIELFRAQVPSDPELPPVIVQPNLGEDIDEELIGEEEERSAPAESSVRAARSLPYDTPRAPAGRRRRCRRPVRGRVPFEDILTADDSRGEGAPALIRTARAAPSVPRFERPLKVRARLTVPRADYTETYTVWWDPANGASRMDFHGGTSSAYRIVRLDGSVQSVLIRVDRTSAEDVRRCVVAPPRRLSLAERALPVLPDLQRFSFAGYVEGSAERVERWRYTLAGRGGELGGARGEALTYRHELLVSRAADNYTTVPIRYSVRVDSSVLGADSDGYVHLYTETSPLAHDPAMLRLDIADACDFVERTERMDRVEPLREFTMLQRDPRHDDALDRYKKKFDRRFADDSEEAVRKNLLIQSYRFAESGNRQGATFELGTNFLSDRLVVERLVLLGAVPPAAERAALPFPHSADDTKAQVNSLPRRFDWRERGAVTSVRNQWLCSSCWAFAVVGAVEGALAINTGRLVPLSEQSLVDCAHPYGTRGCNGSWPSDAYEYVHEMGLPALREYPPYRGEVQQCEAARVPPVTRITGHVNVTRNNLPALKIAIRRHGPTVVIIDAHPASLAAYKKGYYYDGRCRKNSANHALLAVGWTVHRRETYFILKNSWSTGWGEGGYVLMRGPGNTCGVLRRGSYPVLSDTDVQSVPADAQAIAFAPSAPAPDL